MMAQIMASQVISLAGLMDFFKEDRNAIEKGETKYNADFVLECKIVDLTVQGYVCASMKVVNGEGYITSASCQCPRGEWLCSHMAATAIYANRKGFSETNLPNSWISRPKTGKKKDSKIHSITDLFPSDRPG